VQLSEEQIRVLGCLLEKQRTTPDAYPLSLNGLRLACNQSTARDPVVDYDDGAIRDAVRGLERRGLARLASGAGSRAAKYRHLLDEALPLPAPERAVLCTLMLRGAQTPGELKQRAERMHQFAGLADVQQALEALIDRALVRRLVRQPGQKEERYAQQLGDDGEDGAAGAPAGPLAQRGDLQPDRAAGNGELERRVARLEAEVAELRQRMHAGATAGSAPAGRSS
jgi:uncharacterized protein